MEDLLGKSLEVFFFFLYSLRLYVTLSLTSLKISVLLFSCFYHFTKLKHIILKVASSKQYDLNHFTWLTFKKFIYF